MYRFYHCCKKLFLSKRFIKYILLFLLLIIFSAVIIWRIDLYHDENIPFALQQTTFDKLPGWQTADDLSKSFTTLQNSCTKILKLAPEQRMGTDAVPLLAADMQPVCKAASQLAAQDNESIKHFFEKWFLPMVISGHSKTQGLFTGYYLPYIHVRAKKSHQYNVPIYGRPKDLVMINLGLFRKNLKGITLTGKVSNGCVYPYSVSRTQINDGALKNIAPVLAWTDDPVGVFFMQIQGSGIALDHGKQTLLNYDGKNSLPYTAIGKVLIKNGALSKQNISMQTIRAWFIAHPDKINEILNMDESYVFFRVAKGDQPMGAQGVRLTPGYSLAVDRTLVPLGIPLWLQTFVPDTKKPDESNLLQRLMIAQDTGGVILGAVRGDIYWGGGDAAAILAGNMKNSGRYWALLPKQFVLTHLRK